MKRTDSDQALAARTKAPDWRAIHERLEAISAAIEQEWALTPQQAKAVLRARARELAREPDSVRDREEVLEVIEFVVAYETYGIESLFVREVFPLSGLTPVPGMPDHVLGVINARGRILFVIDIKKFFGLPDKGLTDLNKIVILQSQDAEFGVLADTIVGVRRIALQDLQTSLPTLTGIRDDYLKGIATDRMVLLDAARLLSDSGILAQKWKP